MITEIYVENVSWYGRDSFPCSFFFHSGVSCLQKYQKTVESSVKASHNVMGEFFDIFILKPAAEWHLHITC